VLLKSDLDVEQPHLSLLQYRGQFVEQCSSIARALDVTKYIRMRDYDFGHTLLGCKSDLDVQQTHLSLQVCRIDNGHKGLFSKGPWRFYLILVPFSIPL
jgi:hypothetical protein